MPSTFVVLLGADGAGKSSVMAEIARRRPDWRCVSTDSALLAPRHALITRLRRGVVQDVLPALGRDYSPEFLAALLQTAVLHLRDGLCGPDGGRGPVGDRPVIMDSYYYKILAKCRLAGVADNPMFTWWRGFRQPDLVVYLDCDPRTGWQRSRWGELLNPLEYSGSRPTLQAYEAYQRQLRDLMLEEVAALPVVHVPEYDGVEHTARAVMSAMDAPHARPAHQAPAAPPAPEALAS